MTAILQNTFWLVAIGAIAIASQKLRAGGRPTIIPTLLGGILLGNLSLLGISFFEPMKTSGFLELLSEMSIAFFLFSIGFGATLAEVRRVGRRALLIAITGIASTIVLGIFLGPFLIHGLASQGYFFLAVALASTSVGITAGILKDLNILQSSAARLLLTAAIIDDIIGLIILAIVSSYTSLGPGGLWDIGLVISRIAIFVFAGIGIGHLCARILPRQVYQIYPHLSVKLLVALSFFAVFFVLSKAAGLSSIVGAFIGGLVLERGYFNDLTLPLHGEYVEAIIEKISAFVIPVFFVMTGLKMDISAFFSVQTLSVACGLFMIAVFGKFICGFVAGKGNNPWLVGAGMVPRGEVSLVFANMGLITGILTPTLFSAILIVIIATTLLAPAILRRAAVAE